MLRENSKNFVDGTQNERIEREELKLKYCMSVILKEGIVWKKSSCRDGKGKIGEEREEKGKGVHATFLTNH